MKIERIHSLRGSMTVPGDKSISHRAVMFGSIAGGVTRITGFLPGEDCLSTIRCFRQMGIAIEQQDTSVTVYGKGLYGLNAPEGPLFVGNSGTTMRLISGILVGQDFDCILDGDQSIRKRPMRRIITPLLMMGAKISGTDQSCPDMAPLKISGRKGKLRSIFYEMPVASAQVKSCVLLAGLYTNDTGKMGVLEPVPSRDHTERMLSGFGVHFEHVGNSIVLNRMAGLTDPRWDLKGDFVRRILVPGDISSAAYVIAAALLTKDSEVLIRNVGVNPTRDGIIRVAKAMGGKIRYLNEHEESGEPVADLRVESSRLTGTVISGDLIPSLIDEIPVIAVMAAAAEGETVIRDAAELRVKESDRIETVVKNLRSIGVDAKPLEDGMVIKGGPIHGGQVTAFKDHRIAMAFSIAGMISEEPVEIDDTDCVAISWPGFYSDLESIRAE